MEKFRPKKVEDARRSHDSEALSEMGMAGAAKVNEVKAAKRELRADQEEAWRIQDLEKQDRTFQEHEAEKKLNPQIDELEDA